VILLIYYCIFIKKRVTYITDSHFLLLAYTTPPTNTTTATTYTDTRDENTSRPRPGRVNASTQHTKHTPTPDTTSISPRVGCGPIGWFVRFARALLGSSLSDRSRPLTHGAELSPSIGLTLNPNTSGAPATRGGGLTTRPHTNAARAGGDDRSCCNKMTFRMREPGVLPLGRRRPRDGPGGCVARRAQRARVRVDGCDSGSTIRC